MSKMHKRKIAIKKQEEISEIRNPMTLVEIEVPFTVGLHDILRKA